MKTEIKVRKDCGTQGFESDEKEVTEPKSLIYIQCQSV